MTGIICALPGIIKPAVTVVTAKTVTAIGNAQIDTAQSKFGGSSALFDGTDDRLEITPTTTFDDFTVECWIRLANNSGTKNILAFGNESTGRLFFAVLNDRIYWDYYGTTARYGNTSMSANNWYHLAWSRTGSTIKLFVDGVEQTMTTASGSGVFPSGSVGNTNGIFIGTLSDGAIDFNGHIDEVRISTVARYTGNFTPTTVPFVRDADTVLLLHMDADDGTTTFVDDIGGGIGRSRSIMTAVGNAQVDTAQSQFGGASALFDGVGDYITVTHNENLDISLYSNWTIECWARFTEPTGRVVWNKDGLAGTLYPSFEFRTNASKYISFGQGGNATNFQTITYSTALSSNVWYHFAAVKNGTTVRLYVDGTERGTAYTWIGDQDDGRDMWIGRQDNDAGTMYGHIDECRISKIARYTANFNVPTIGFTDR